MDYKELKKLYSDTIRSITEHKLHNAFLLLQKMVSKSGKSDFQNRYDNQYSTYQNMLKYSFEYQDDPEKVNVYNRLLRSLLMLSDEVKEDISYNYRMKQYYQQKDLIRQYYNIDENESSQLVDLLTFEKEIEDILKDSKVTKEGSDDIENNKTRIENLFRFLWLSDKYHNTELELVSKIIENPGLPWYNKSLVVTAVTLSLLRYFDENKFIVLFNAIEKNEEQVWQRAFIGLIFAIMFYDNRLSFYPEMQNRLKLMQENDSFKRNLEMFAIQFTWQKESEKIAKRINEELMPDMLKMKSIIEEKLDLDNIVSPEGLREKNPDWEDYFKDSPGIYKKIEEIQNLQTEGADIFMGAFSMLKQFPFFNEISNWFVPFHEENATVKEISNELKDIQGFNGIVKGLLGTYFLCNSDKYSFCYNMKFVLKTQNPGMMDMFKQELDAMNEVGEDGEKINVNVKNKSIFTQYLQDLYRFYKLYPGKHEFEDVFGLNTSIHETSFMKQFNDETKIVHKLAEFYFNQDYYDRALEIFLQLQKVEQTNDLLEKIAYCYQHLGKLDEAISYYEKALLIDKNQKWKYHQLAYCYRKNTNYKGALKYYQMLEKEDEEDLILQADIGHVYLCMEDYENALKYYFKVEYLAPDNVKVRRPLAWCSFLTGKLDAAKKYFEKIINAGPNKNDLLNLGHVLWSSGDKKGAIANYKNAYSMSGKDSKWFERVMFEDAHHLEKNGIEKLDIFLMVDYVKMGEGL